MPRFHGTRAALLVNPDPPLPGFVAAGANTAFTTVINTGSVPVPAGVQNGDLLLAFIGIGSQPAVTPDAAWTLVKQQNGGIRRLNVYSRIAASEPANYTLATFDANATGNAQILAFRPAAASGAVEANAGNDNPSDTAHPAPTVTALGNNRILVCAWVCSPSLTTLTVPGSMTLRGTGSSGVFLRVGVETVQTGATGTRTATAGGAGTGAAVSLLVKGA